MCVCVSVPFLSSRGGPQKGRNIFLSRSMTPSKRHGTIRNARGKYRENPL